MSRASLVDQTVKNLPAIQETWDRFMSQFYPLEKKMATHYSVLAWNPRDGAAWWVAVYGVAQSWT